MSATDNAFAALMDLRLWFKVNQGTDLVLADIPEIVPLRWAYLRDNWEFVKVTLLQNLSSASDPAQLQLLIDDFSQFVELQRNSNSRANPLRDKNIFRKYYALFDNMPISQLQLSKEERDLMASSTSRVQRFYRTDFKKIIDLVRAGRDEQSDIIGGTDDDYNRVFTRAATATLKTNTPKDTLSLMSFQDAIKTCEFVLSNLFSSEASFVDPFALARANANNPDFDVTTYQAGVLVRMQYGDSLATLAARYLGSPDKWIEIAVANGLKPPYIDEVGIDIPLVSNGADNLINLPKFDGLGGATIDRVYVNQVIFLQSNSIVFPEQHTVLNLKVVPISGEIVLELDGELDLSRFTVADAATVRLFKPNTTNSQFFVLMPVDGLTAPRQINEVPWFLKSKKEDEKQAGIDLAVDDNGDIIFAANGDLSLSYGVANALQALKFKMLTEQGTLNRHSEEGIISVLGSTTTDTSTIKERLVESIRGAVEADRRFSAVEQINVSTLTNNNASGFLVQLVVRLAGTNTAVPISFTINPT